MLIFAALPLILEVIFSKSLESIDFIDPELLNVATNVMLVSGAQH